MAVNTQLQVRRGSASQWTSANPTLAAGEFGFESDTGKFKIGTGSTAWTSLVYASLLSSEIPELSQDAIDSALTAGTGITKTYNDAANTLTLAVDTSTIATKTYADSAVSTGVAALIASAPSTLDTLNELAAALGNDANYASTITTALGLKAPLSGPTFTGTVVLPSTTSIGTVSSTEIGYVDGVTSAIQTQLDDKSTASKTETLTNKTLTSPVINTPTGITKTDVGLANVNNTTDANKPVSTATQTALDLKANLSGPTFTGTVVLPSNTVTNDMLAGSIANNKLANSSVTINGSAVSLGGSTTIQAGPDEIAVIMGALI